MIFKYFIFAFVCCVLITASDPYFGSDLSWRPLPEDASGDVKEINWKSSSSFKRYLDDYDDRVSDLFKIDPYFYPNTQFWFQIYTQFDYSHAVIHDKTNLNLVYKVLDFSLLYQKEIPKNTLYVLQKKITQEKVSEFKKDLEELAKDPFSLTPTSRKIYQVIRQAGIQLPIKKSDRSIFFTDLKHNLRTQTGQKNFIRDGVIRSLPYQKFLLNYFTSKNLPVELLSIPFLESSFNPRAHSKVNALGAWQFMPLIASFFVPKRTNLADYRSNIGVSSIAGSFLMAENFKILKSWDLAVTAYNSGTKHLLKTKRSLKADIINLETVIKNSDSGHFGFASKNFYSEFLALAHTLAYREELFDDLHAHDRKDVDESLSFYLAKCTVTLKKILNDVQTDDVLFHNHQLSDLKQSIPRGFILTTKSPLPSKQFYKISDSDLKKKKPIDWLKLMKNQSCSTR